MENTIEIIDEGVACLVKNLGVLKAEKFIATMKRESFDYTKWQRDYFDKMEPDQFHQEALEYAKVHPHTGNGKRL